jgi:PEGA domain
MIRFFVLLSVLTSFSCASLTASMTQPLAVNSYPPGADVYVNGNAVGVTPMTVEIPRKDPTVVKVGPPGQTRSCSLSSSAGGGYIAADVILCVLLFPFGCISFIDAGGAWNELRETTCDVNLQAAGEGVYLPISPTPAPAPSPTAGCGSDSDCKGDRICQAGQCVSPR